MFTFEQYCIVFRRTLNRFARIPKFLNTLMLQDIYLVQMHLFLVNHGFGVNMSFPEGNSSCFSCLYIGLGIWLLLRFKVIRNLWFRRVHDQEHSQSTVTQVNL